MKKIASVVLAIILLSITSFAQSQGSWYFSSKGKNDRPSLPDPGISSAKGIGKAEKVLYLTFDAGYENSNVAKTVKILEEEQVTAAFFVLRHFVTENPELCKTIKKNGNLICNHTASHPNITRLSEAGIQKELRLLEEAMKETLGFGPDPYFRPPEGAYSKEALEAVEKAGYKTVFWSLAWADWDNNNQKTPEYAMEKLTSRVHDGAVILLHPTSETNTKILAKFIQSMKEKGYRFGSVEELWEEA